MGAKNLGRADEPAGGGSAVGAGVSGLLPTSSAAAAAKLGLRLLWRQRWLLLATVTLLLLGTAAMLLVPPLLGAVVDAVIAGEPFTRVLWLGVAIAGAGVTAAALEGIGGVLLVRCLQHALAALREDVFDAALNLPLRRVEAAGDADVISRVTNDVEAVTEAIAGVIPLCARAVFTIVLTLVGMAALDPWLALAALVAVPIQIASTRAFMRRSRPLYARLRREEAERGRAFVEAVAGAETVRAYGTAEEHLTAIARASDTAVRTHRETGKARNIFIGGLNGAEFVGLAAVLAVGFVRATAAGLSVGAVTAGALYFHRLFNPIGDLLGSMDDLQRALAGLQRLTGVVIAGAEARADTFAGAGSSEIADGAVEVLGVSFRYGAQTRRAALQGVDLSIPAGATVALIGTSGSGKSTLARLIAGFDEPAAGGVRIGGVPAHVARSGGRPAALLVAQETHLFAGTVGDNVRIAAPGASDRELAAALAEVGFDLAAVPGGLDGTLPPAVSHREAQQLALARVLLADPPVVVLDEAGSQAGSDAALATAMRRVSAGRTAVVIAHHLDQVRGADRVVVLEQGCVIEQGEPGELLERPDGAFARLWRMAQWAEE
ncbi:ABC transporter ATP-binding protein [Leucobacter aridicollis]|uniref:ATP-binding cassette subfamily C protein n=1 Tax=Leucobacter aridicollis TaxID=283878 RepID=A0A852R4H1_9MICO|nr:ABC transporter ATP-binding protein [Leucobacter aridicollis]NYD26435.1 ATP-binding cassette subfamily C protein [Leucobacter aridicollis]